MMRTENRFYLGLALLLTVLLLPLPAEPAAAVDDRPAGLEEQGIESNGPTQRSTTVRSRPEGDVLLIPDSGTDRVGMYDPLDGTYLGDIIDGAGLFAAPINAVLGPDGYIYVSDQVNDAVYVFNEGTYLYTYADATDGLDNIRGIDFRDGHLFVTSGDDYVAEFDGPHNRLPDFINDGTDPFDIYFLPDGRSLLADIQGSTDNVRLYDTDGTLLQVLFAVNFPEQIQIDPLGPGAFLNAAFSADVISDFELDGTVVQTTPFGGGRGIYRLGNGNLLATAGDGVFEIEPGTGAILEQENTGAARFIEFWPGGPLGLDDTRREEPRLDLRATGPGPGSILTFVLPASAQTEVGIYSVQGRRVASLWSGVLDAGSHSFRWDLSGGSREIPSGVYLACVRTGAAMVSVPIVIVR